MHMFERTQSNMRSIYCLPFRRTSKQSFENVTLIHAANWITRMNATWSAQSLEQSHGMPSFILAD